MRILGLYNNICALDLFHWLEEEGNELVLTSDPISFDWCVSQAFDLAVSYTYRFILSEEILNALNNNVVNIHNSFLPWNRGADPNLWSIVDKSPRGVTLHYMNASLDKGYIIAQEIVDDDDSESLASSYGNLDKAAKALFKKAFKYYEYWPSLKKECLGSGSYHSVQDGKTIKSVIDGYDLSITEYRRRLGDLHIG